MDFRHRIHVDISGKHGVGKDHTEHGQFFADGSPGVALGLHAGDITLDIQGPDIPDSPGKGFFEPSDGILVVFPGRFPYLLFVVLFPLVGDGGEGSAVLGGFVVFRDLPVDLPAGVSPERNALALNHPDSLKETVRPLIILLLCHNRFHILTK